ncbi:MAG: tRNA (N(6)-L-threonylcarbamoyladenosine(37)-C(2))-methylthiotransferase MtaB [Clostridia bacterium]|nr:tRNA (N(6)-L-threonylcarbamoyladenosine(37)-C(2))-methylthiotransferase MtaB [Clostridia bacterium]
MKGRVALRALGCKVSQYDGEAMLARFQAEGYAVVDFDDLADVYIVNACAVTHEAERKARQLVRRAYRRNPDAIVVLAGCYPQTSPAEAASLPGVSVVIGNAERGRVVELVERARADGEPVSLVGNIFAARTFEELSVEGFLGRTRAAVKVQDGCNEFCTYCIIPYARGGLRSRPLASVQEEVARLAAAGFREVVLTGIHLGAYGRDLPDRPGLADLVRAVAAVGGVDRIRLSSVEPMDVDRRLLEAMAEDLRVCPHLHLPVQSGCDRILARMRRRYKAAEVEALVAEARRRIPDLAVTTDVIVGFPGESEADFAETLAFVERVGFTRVHVFPFSPRRGTPAAAYPDQVPYDVKNRRVRALIELGDRLAETFHRRQVGRRATVLVEAADGKEMEGLTANYVRVRFPGDPCWHNRLVHVEVEGADAEGVWGRPVGVVGPVPAA